MKPQMTNDIRLILPRSAVTVIADECDRFDQDETGGRVIGNFNVHEGKLTLQITGIIESGPRAKRSPVSFFQDGEHQERIFRDIEHHHPEIEHLGNWHTHHVNGLATLSSGDIATYHRIVNHHNHNTNFFYALLVVARRRSKKPDQRYEIKHFVFRRGDDHFYEISPRQIEIVDTPLLWPPDVASASHHGEQPTSHKAGSHLQRVYDRDILREFYPELRPLSSKKIDFYWRGPVELLDSSRIEVILVEDSTSRTPTYSIVLRDPPDVLHSVSTKLAECDFPSARAALIVAERSCNRALFEQHSFLHGRKS